MAGRLYMRVMEADAKCVYIQSLNRRIQRLNRTSNPTHAPHVLLHGRRRHKLPKK
jgi:hypothetical protein